MSGSADCLPHIQSNKSVSACQATSLPNYCPIVTIASSKSDINSQLVRFPASAWPERKIRSHQGRTCRDGYPGLVLAPIAPLGPPSNPTPSERRAERPVENLSRGIPVEKLSSITKYGENIFKNFGIQFDESVIIVLTVEKRPAHRWAFSFSARSGRTDPAERSYRYARTNPLCPHFPHLFTSSLIHLPFLFTAHSSLLSVHCYLSSVFQITLAVLPPLNRIKPQGLPDFFCARKNQTALVFINW